MPCQNKYWCIIMMQHTKGDLKSKWLWAGHNSFSAGFYEVQREQLQSPRSSVSASAFHHTAVKFYVQVFWKVRSQQPIIRKHYIWNIGGTLEGRLSFHDSWHLGACPRVRLQRSKSRTSLKMFQLSYYAKHLCSWSCITGLYDIDLCVMRSR